MITIYIVFHIKYAFILSDFSETYISSTDFSKIPQISNFMKIHPVRAELFCEDGQVDRHDEANSRFSQFCERA
jgi:hypothetical protein